MDSNITELAHDLQKLASRMEENLKAVGDAEYKYIVAKDDVPVAVQCDWAGIWNPYVFFVLPEHAERIEHRLGELSVAYYKFVLHFDVVAYKPIFLDDDPIYDYFPEIL